MIVSPDLTMNDKAKNAPAKPTGGITPDVTGAETYGTIISISESPRVPGLIWVGTDDGNVQLTRNGGVTWTNITARFYDLKTGKAKPGVKGAVFPLGLWCSRVEASHFDEGTCYVTFDGHRSDDFHPYVFKTTDFGETWTAVAAGIPDGQPVYVIREDPVAKNLLFLGTEFGVFFSRDAGATWSSLKLNMPTVAFHDLLIHPRDSDLIAATHGRGFWILDDITALRKTTDSVLGQDAAVFDPGKPGTRWLRVQRGGYGRGDLFFKGENPPEGALLNFYLKAKPAAKVAGHPGGRRPRRPAKTTYHPRRGRAGHQPRRLGPPVRPAVRDHPDPRRQHQAADRSGPVADRPHRRTEGRPQEGPGRSRQVGDQFPQGHRRSSGPSSPSSARAAGSTAGGGCGAWADRPPSPAPTPSS